MIIRDTNAASEAMRTTPSSDVMAWLENHEIASLAITAPTIAGILNGIRRLPAGRRRSDIERRFAIFLNRGFRQRVLPFDQAAADAYADIVVARERIGRPIGIFDAMIAAVAQANGAALATRDIGGFSDCGLTVINPWALA